MSVGSAADAGEGAAGSLVPSRAVSSTTGRGADDNDGNGPCESGDGDGVTLPSGDGRYPRGPPSASFAPERGPPPVSVHSTHLRNGRLPSADGPLPAARSRSIAASVTSSSGVSHGVAVKRGNSTHASAFPSTVAAPTVAAPATVGVSMAAPVCVAACESIPYQYFMPTQSETAPHFMHRIGSVIAPRDVHACSE